MTDILQFFNVNNPSQITIDMVRNVNVATANQYFEKLHDEGYSNSTINRKLQALSKLYKFFCRKEIGVIDYNPFSSDEGTARLKVRNYSNTRSLTDNEVRTFMSVLSIDRTILGVRNKIIMLLIATTGMRRAEVSSLYIGMIGKMMGKTIIDFSGKGNKERFVEIADSIKKLIDQYLKLRGLTYMDKNQPLFVSHAHNADPTKPIGTETIYRLVKGVAKEAGLDESSISPHCFRHTYITKSLDLGCDISDIQDRVGHSSISTTRRYDHTQRILKNNPANALAEMFDVE
jgi:site-specific recombinase XerD